MKLKLLVGFVLWVITSGWTIYLPVVTAPYAATLVGTVTYADGAAVADETPVRLATVYWSDDRSWAVYILDGARSAGTLTQGSRFEIPVQAPGWYLVVIGYVEVNAYYIHPVVYELREGERLDIGMVVIYGGR